jgi:hypothetical protein
MEQETISEQGDDTQIEVQPLLIPTLPSLSQVAGHEDAYPTALTL